MPRCSPAVDLSKAWPALTAGVVALVIALGLCVPVQAAAATTCVGAQEARAHAAGDSGEEAPLTFTTAFYKRLYLLDVSLDGADGNELPIAIEEVCNVPAKLGKQATQLAGGDGVALLLSRTAVWQDGTQLSGEAATAAIDGADTAVLRVRLLRRPKWRKDEDGSAVPTFRTGRVEVTD